MSIINVDDPGIPHTELATALAGLRRDAVNSGVHPAYKRALRYGAPGTRHHITVAGQPVTILLGDNPPYPPDPARERASWIELRDAISDVTASAVSRLLPAEIAAAIWEQDGRQIRVCRPGAAAAMRRARNRLRRGLSALSPVPILAAVSQPVTGSAAAVGLALAPVMPPTHDFPPAPPAIRMQTPFTGGDIQRPALPWAPGLTPAAVSIRITPDRETPPAEDTAFDTEDVPAPAPAKTRRPAAPPRTGSASPTPTSTAPTPDPQEDPRESQPMPDAPSTPAPVPTPSSTPTTAQTALNSPKP